MVLDTKYILEFERKGHAWVEYGPVLETRKKAETNLKDAAESFPLATFRIVALERKEIKRKKGLK